MKDIYTTGHEYEFENYGLDIYPENFFDDFVDIGGCYGTISFMIAGRNSDARVFCYEPSEKEFVDLKKKALIYSNIFPINRCLGNGKELFINSRKAGQHTFMETKNEDSKKQYSKPSNTVKEIFNINKIDTSNKYGLKIDCEGGERFLIDDHDAEEIIRKSCHLAMEIHFNHKELKQHFWFRDFPYFVVYNDWVRDNFSDTHNIKYWKSRRKSGVGVYVLTNKRNNYEKISS